MQAHHAFNVKSVYPSARPISEWLRYSLFTSRDQVRHLTRVIGGTRVIEGDTTLSVHSGARMFDLVSLPTSQALFPDNTYGVDSGGDPAAIPKLTFDYFKNFHRCVLLDRSIKRLTR